MWSREKQLFLRTDIRLYGNQGLCWLFVLNFLCLKTCNTEFFERDEMSKKLPLPPKFFDCYKSLWKNVFWKFEITIPSWSNVYEQSKRCGTFLGHLICQGSMYLHYPCLCTFDPLLTYTLQKKRFTKFYRKLNITFPTAQLDRGF